MRTCKICGEIIPEGRLKALPDTETCVEHSEIKKKLGFKIITGKTTYTELDIVDDEIYEKLNEFDRKNFSAIG